MRWGSFGFDRLQVSKSVGVMADNRVKIDLAKFIQQVLPQLPDTKEREIFLHWLDRSPKKKLIVEIDMNAVQP